MLKMFPDNPLAKRIKRHVIGQAHDFFAATSPHLEQLCFDELSHIFTELKTARPVAGGVEFRGRLEDCYAANLLLRIPNRIWMRVAAFKATNFRQLEKKLSGIPWELYINAGAKPVLHVKTVKCRLHHRTAIADRLVRSIQSRRMIQPPQPSHSAPRQTDVQRILVNAREDRFMVSLDSSGNLLFKRGIKQNVGKAPLRETIAAAILHVAGYSGAEPLIDPMCGSGTFSLEAAMIAGHIPPGWFRTFAFMTWPAFKKAQWEYLRRIHAPALQPPTAAKVFAADKAAAMCGNLERISKQFGLSGTIRVMHKNFFEWMPTDATRQTGLVVLNPPLGIRMAFEGPAADYYQEISAKLKEDYRGWRIALLSPDIPVIRKLFNNLKILPIYHGGLHLLLMIGSADNL
jgi:putative N6-adenine-specific DNA methylase